MPSAACRSILPPMFGPVIRSSRRSSPRMVSLAMKVSPFSAIWPSTTGWRPPSMVRLVRPKTPGGGSRASSPLRRRPPACRAGQRHGRLRAGGRPGLQRFEHRFVEQSYARQRAVLGGGALSRRPSVRGDVALGVLQRLPATVVFGNFFNIGVGDFDEAMHPVVF